MATWIIGDLQGCLTSLESLLSEIGFASARDELIFVGDLVNRGPASEGCLRRVRSLAEAGSARCVLGNHDLHLLAVAAGLRPPNADDTLDDILGARDRDGLLDWLARQPLALRPGERDVVAHAGLHPAWDIDTVEQCAREVESELSSGNREAFLKRMYGNEPARWIDCHDAEGRQRFAVNVFTRMRFVTRNDNALRLKAKGSAAQPPEGCVPWFAADHARARDTRVFFGHWSTLDTVAWPQYGVYGLDTGCIWNGRLTACEPATLTLCSIPAAPGDGRAPI